MQTKWACFFCDSRQSKPVIFTRQRENIGRALRCLCCAVLFSQTRRSGPIHKTKIPSVFCCVVKVVQMRLRNEPRGDPLRCSPSSFSWKERQTPISASRQADQQSRAHCIVKYCVVSRCIGKSIFIICRTMSTTLTTTRNNIDALFVLSVAFRTVYCFALFSKQTHLLLLLKPQTASHIIKIQHSRKQ